MMAQTATEWHGSRMSTKRSQTGGIDWQRVTILVVENNSSDARLVGNAFSHIDNASVKIVATLQEAFQALKEGPFDLIVSALSLADGQGTALLSDSATPVILLIEPDDENGAVTAMNSGALDYVIKTPKSIRRVPQISIEALSEWNHLRRQREMEEELRFNKRALQLKHFELQELFNQVSSGKKEWEQTMDCLQDIIVLTDDNGRVLRTNQKFTELSRKSYEQILGIKLTDTLADLAIILDEKRTPANFEYFHQPTGRWYWINTYEVDNLDCGTGTVIAGHDYTELRELNRCLEESNLSLQQKRNELEEAYHQLKTTQEKVLHQEKMATIGQLTAGVAHEINNPVGYILSNMTTLTNYLRKLKQYVDAQSELIKTSITPEKTTSLQGLARELKIDFVLDDLDQLVSESIDGADRVKKIVTDLKSFSRADQGVLEECDINELLDACINIVWNELKYKTTLYREYGDLSTLLCYPLQLNQVMTNLLINAAQAIENQGDITVKTWAEGGQLCIAVTDTGCGIPPEQIKRIFDPFYTTKDLGSGTGLGLSVSYEIVRKHHGEISVKSTLGGGSTFTVCLPCGNEVDHDEKT